MRQATEIYAREFDSRFFELPLRIREQIESKIREMGRRLETFPHHRLQGRPEFRLRVGDYRIIYDLDIQRNELFLVTLGHRREVYRY
jgi:mRNA interferase RelE/StbE